MKLKLTALLLTLAVGVFAFLPFSAAAQTNPLKNIALTDSTGNLTNAVFSVTSFTSSGGKLFAVGNLTGTLNNQQINQTVRMPVSVANASCDILNLQLGPLELNLLGLQINLSQVNLDITAQTGSGNLLGNLLCSIAKLLDSNGSLNAIAQKLNQILRALG